MTDEVVKHLRQLSVANEAKSAASKTLPAQVHAVAGLDLALASLRELIGQSTGRAIQQYSSVHARSA